MTRKAQGFIIRKLPYGDNSAILKVFTSEEGLMTFMVHGMQRKKGSNAPLSQLMNYVELVYYPSASSDINKVKELQSVSGHAGLLQHPVKIQVLLFCAELLHYVLQEKAPDPELFRLIEHFFNSLSKEDVYVHHPLWFLLKLLKIQGVEPHLYIQEHLLGFSPETGSMVAKDSLIRTETYLPMEGCLLAIELLQATLDELAKLQSTASLRHETMDRLVVFCELHLLQGKKLRSVDIIREVLRS
jgi:DNA repair protein RecO (recombination protein O)